MKMAFGYLCTATQIATFTRRLTNSQLLPDSLNDSLDNFDTDRLAAFHAAHNLYDDDDLLADLSSFDRGLTYSRWSHKESKELVSRT